MGQLRFIVPAPERLAQHGRELAYVAGADGIPWEGRAKLDGKLLTIDRDQRESGWTYVPWHVPKRGVLMLCTGSLMERQQAYSLPIELARGTITRLRNQAAAWQQAGMNLPPAFVNSSRLATAKLIAAITERKEEAAAALADESLLHGLDAADHLAVSYTQQVLDIRRGQHSVLPTLLGARLEKAPAKEIADELAAASNTSLISPRWPIVEPEPGQFAWENTDGALQWARERGQRVCLGPLVQLDRASLPDWLFLMADDFDEVLEYVLQYLEAVVQRYRGRVHLWHVAARMNLPTGIAMDEEQRLKLTVEAIDRVRTLDPRTPMVVSFDRPWAEYIAAEDQELTPLHFADTLVRGGLGLAGVGLELNLGYWPGGSAMRDLLEISRLIDRWSQLGVPLVLQLTMPSNDAPDPLARHHEKPHYCQPFGPFTPTEQAAVMKKLGMLLLAKQPVQAVFWNQVRDDSPHDYPLGGLVDMGGKLKPLVPVLAKLRADLLS
ncbi:endo-1,4-beta-xylanase [Anatilimnocola floriformis]|uniref:endo-1,4-beta-xylanase n=1 Tax=Anatilimnocola floriformis TaxID=2948575 RepID=UPI0020C469D0|nr:endo-1,4-beta-xylanase [Anatilimnocola floriformis]